MDIDLSTGLLCACCGNNETGEGQLEIYDPVCRLVVAQPTYITANEPGFFIVEDDKGSPLYQTFFMHGHCWQDSIALELENMLEEAEYEPHFDRAGLGSFECDICTSDIRAWEVSGVVALGEFRRSSRTPMGHGEFDFHVFNEKLAIVCLSCLNIINEDVLQFWDTPVKNGDECEWGAMERCWRHHACSDPGRSERCRLYQLRAS